jgi:hypothetical protein
MGVEYRTMGSGIIVSARICICMGCMINIFGTTRGRGEKCVLFYCIFDGVFMYVFYCGCSLLIFAFANEQS